MTKMGINTASEKIKSGELTDKVGKPVLPAKVHPHQGRQDCLCDYSLWVYPSCATAPPSDLALFASSLT